RDAAREHLPPVRLAEAPPPRVPDLRFLQGPRGRPAQASGSVVPRVAVDALGGDRAPEEVVAGALEAAAEGIEVTLHGPAGIDTGGLELVEAPDRIDMAEKAVEAVRAKPDSSLVSTVRAVADGRADAAVSAGNTGAVLAAGLLHLRRLPGV